MDNRNIGLDVIRTIAIFMVIVSHGRHILHFDSVIFGQGLWRLSIFGYYGVELFFVLSGFLIGRILVDMFVWGGSTVPLKELEMFWIRRWFRTLPLYYLMLAVNIAYNMGLPYMTNGYYAGEKYNSLYLCFLQNYGDNNMAFFPESWSLAVEEWFYLLFPLVMFLAIPGCNKYLKKIDEENRDKLFFVYVCFLVIVLINLARLVYTLAYNPSWGLGIRANIFLRFDSILVGVVLAYLCVNKRDVFVYLSNKKYMFLGIIIVLLVSLYYWIIGPDSFSYRIFPRTLMMPLISLSFALLVSKVYFLKINGKIASIFTLTSKISYSIYLIHYPLFQLAWYHTLRIDDMWLKLAVLIFTTTLVYLISFLCYRFYEKPVMDLRELIRV